MRPVVPALVIWALGSALAAAQVVDPDTDKDGLTDFQEVHKYLTDPAVKDTDGDGTPDGDWDERREYAYTITTVVQVLGPVDLDAANDDQQDARLVARDGDVYTLEVVHYPLNTAGEAIVADPDWRKTARKFKEYLRSTTTSNFDRAMQDTLAEELRRDRAVDPDTATDLDLAQAASRQLMERSTFEDGFTTFLADFKGGKAVVPPALRERVARDCAKVGRGIEEEWDRELFAKGMFQNQVHGSCTSSAIYLCGGLRAAGVPTRIVLVIPVADTNDPDELRMVEEGIHHHAVRAEVLQGLRKIGGGWASHTFNEVLVGGRWRRLNYTRLGQPNLDRNLYGLTTHILTVTDWADARMARTVGLRQGLGNYDDVFGHANPYSLVSLKDEFGAHAEIDNPEVAAPTPIEFLPIDSCFFVASKDRPRDFAPSGIDLQADRWHVVLVVARDWARQEFDRVQEFWNGVPKEFQLEGPDGEAFRVEAVRGFWQGERDGAPYLYFLLRLDPGDREQMTAGTGYRVRPADPDHPPRFVAPDDLTLHVPDSSY